MSDFRISVLISVVLLLSGGLLQAEEDNRSWLRPDVDNPLPETNEGLGGVGWEEGFSTEIEQSREIRKQEQERKRMRLQDDNYREHVQEIKKEVPIYDGTTASQPAPANDNAVIREESDGSLRITE